MTKNKLAKARDTMEKFYIEHSIGITNALVVAIPTMCGVAAFVLERHWYKQHVTAIAGCDIIADTDGFGVTKDNISFWYAPKTAAETIQSIKENGFAISEQGIDIMKAIIDNPVIVD